VSLHLEGLRPRQRLGDDLQALVGHWAGLAYSLREMKQEIDAALTTSVGLRSLNERFHAIAAQVPVWHTRGLQDAIEYVVALYWQCWHIEEAYAIVKRLLSLAYFHSDAQNAVELQVWAIRLLYAVLVDLADTVAEALNQPFAASSIEMVHCSLYYFTQAYQRGQATDVVAFLVANAKLYGLLKRPRKRAQRNLLLELSHLTNLGEP
jgi:hypothetical protein